MAVLAADVPYPGKVTQISSHRQWSSKKIDFFLKTQHLTCMYWALGWPCGTQPASTSFLSSFWACVISLRKWSSAGLFTVQEFSNHKSAAALSSEWERRRIHVMHVYHTAMLHDMCMRLKAQNTKHYKRRQSNCITQSKSLFVLLTLFCTHTHACAWARCTHAHTISLPNLFSNGGLKYKIYIFRWLHY